MCLINRYIKIGEGEILNSIVQCKNVFRKTNGSFNVSGLF
jgi:hypothetical protein